MSSFTFVRGTDGVGVIRGQDKYGVQGSIIVSTVEYDRLQEITSRLDKGAQVDEVIRDFWAPLVDKIADIEAGEEDERVDPLDSHRVIHESVAHVSGSPAVSVDLDYDGTCILAVVEGHHHRLAWVMDELFIEGLPPVAATPVHPGEFGVPF